MPIIGHCRKRSLSSLSTREYATARGLEAAQEYTDHPIALYGGE